MQRKLVLEFTKMSGAGNDFIVIDNRFYYFSAEELSRLARTYCPRRTQVGADGLLALSPAEADNHHFRMRYYNADGSLGTMCGNGARCLARFARNAGIVADRYHFESDAGLYHAIVPTAATAPVRLFVPPPQHYVSNQLLTDFHETGPFHALWTGTEHVACFVPNVKETPVEAWGKRVRHDPALAPAGANVNFIEVVDAKSTPVQLRMRTFEKGVEAETLACGTGATAAALLSRLQGLHTENAVAVAMHGGVLTVGYTYENGDFSDVYLEGAAETVYRGTLEIDGL